jgi:hypothetical protein
MVVYPFIVSLLYAHTALQNSEHRPDLWAVTARVCAETYRQVNITMVGGVFLHQPAWLSACKL